MTTRVYLDNAATTPVDKQVLACMMDTMEKNYGNPSSTHSVGQEAKTVIENVRRQIAKVLNAQPSEIIFTSCGTESNNMIIHSCVDHLEVKRIITSPLEHKCVAEAIRDAKMRKGVEVVYLRPDKMGVLSLTDLEDLLKSSDKKTLISLMHANNEVGNLLDLKKVSQLAQQYNALFHSDTVQTIGHLPLDLTDIPLDFASCSAHKFHGPKGSGFAFIRKTSRLKPYILGGPQERELRAGTENVAGIAGLGKAFELAYDNLETYSKHISEIKNYAIQQLKDSIPGVTFNGLSGDLNSSLYTVLSVLLPFKNPLIGLQLDMKGIAISQGSACSAGASKPSMVLMMLLDDHELENSTPLRISFSHLTTKEEIDYFVQAVKEISSSSLIENADAIHR